MLANRLLCADLEPPACPPCEKWPPGAISWWWVVLALGIGGLVGAAAACLALGIAFFAWRRVPWAPAVGPRQHHAIGVRWN